MKLLRLFALFFLSAAVLPAFAEPVAKLPSAPPRAGELVAAVVNGEIISRHDLDQRLKLALLISGLPDTAEERSRVVGPLLRRLVDEDLKIQAAAKEKIIVSAADIELRLKGIEEQNKMEAGGFIKLLVSKGIEPDAMRQQIRGEIAWSSLVHQVLIRKVHVSENAVTTRLDAIKANFGKPEYRASEIYLSLDGAKNEVEIRDLAERLTDQMRHGAPFEAIARQFNQEGAADGSLGWVSEGMLDDELLKALDQLQPSGVTPPIRTTDGYVILTLLERRKVGEGMGSGPTVDLMIIDLNSLASASQVERDLQMQHLRDIEAPAKSCDDLIRVGRQAPSAAFNIMEKLPISQLPAKVEPLIKDLAPGQMSDPTEAPKGRRFFAVCGRGNGTSEGLPSADDIRSRMEKDQLDLVARHYLLDLHSDATIDIRQ